MIFFYRSSNLELLTTGLAQIAKTLNELLLDEKVWRRSKNKSHALQVLLLGIRATFSKLILFTNCHQIAKEAFKTQKDKEEALGSLMEVSVDQQEENETKQAKALLMRKTIATNPKLNESNIKRKILKGKSIHDGIPIRNGINESSKTKGKVNWECVDLFDRYLVSVSGLAGSDSIKEKRKNALFSFFRQKMEGWRKKLDAVGNKKKIIDCKDCLQEVLLCDKEKHGELCKRHLKLERRLFFLNSRLRDVFFVVYKAKKKLVRVLDTLK